MGRPVRILIAVLALAAVAWSAGGCGESSRDMSVEQISNEAEVGITREELEDRLGEPAADVTSSTGQGVELLEFEAKDKQLVSITLEGGRVSAVKVLGSESEQQVTPTVPTPQQP